MTTRSECPECGSTVHVAGECPFLLPREQGQKTLGVLTGARLGEVFMHPDTLTFPDEPGSE